jgi:hypothetical protein
MDNARLAKYVSGKWLEVRYGWSPILYSIYDALDTLGLQLCVKGRYQIKVSSKRFMQAGVHNNGTGSYSNPKAFTYSTTSVRHKYAMTFNLPSNLRQRDWTSLSPLSIAWELLPFSFVADWLVNVEQQLSLWENYWLYKSEYAGGYETTTYKRKTTRVENGSTDVGYTYWPNGSLQDGSSKGIWNWSSFAELQTTNKTRALVNSIPMPNGFQVKVKLTPKRLLDAFALTTQIAGKYRGA